MKQSQCDCRFSTGGKWCGSDLSTVWCDGCEKGTKELLQGCKLVNKKHLVRSKEGMPVPVYGGNDNKNIVGVMTHDHVMLCDESTERIRIRMPHCGSQDHFVEKDKVSCDNCSYFDPAAYFVYKKFEEINTHLPVHSAFTVAKFRAHVDFPHEKLKAFKVVVILFTDMMNNAAKECFEEIFFCSIRKPEGKNMLDVINKVQNEQSSQGIIACRCLKTAEDERRLNLVLDIRRVCEGLSQLSREADTKNIDLLLQQLRNNKPTEVEETDFSGYFQHGLPVNFRKELDEKSSQKQTSPNSQLVYKAPTTSSQLAAILRPNTPAKYLKTTIDVSCDDGVLPDGTKVVATIYGFIQDQQKKETVKNMHYYTVTDSEMPTDIPSAETSDWVQIPPSYTHLVFPEVNLVVMDENRKARVRARVRVPHLVEEWCEREKEIKIGLLFLFGFVCDFDNGWVSTENVKQVVTSIRLPMYDSSIKTVLQKIEKEAKGPFPIHSSFYFPEGLGPEITTDGIRRKEEDVAEAKKKIHRFQQKTCSGDAAVVVILFPPIGEGAPDEKQEEAHHRELENLLGEDFVVLRYRETAAKVLLNGYGSFIKKQKPNTNKWTRLPPKQERYLGYVDDLVNAVKQITVKGADPTLDHLIGSLALDVQKMRSKTMPKPSSWEGLGDSVNHYATIIPMISSSSQETKTVLNGYLPTKLLWNVSLGAKHIASVCPFAWMDISVEPLYTDRYGGWHLVTSADQWTLPGSNVIRTGRLRGYHRVAFKDNKKSPISVINSSNDGVCLPKVTSGVLEVDPQGIYAVRHNPYGTVN